MANSLSALFQEIAQADNEQHLQQQVVPKIGKYFAAKRYRLFFLDQLPPKMSGLFQRALSIEHNPILRYVFEHHAPVHEGVLLPASEWKIICPRFDHGHVIAGPIVNDGALVGGIGLTRDRHASGFNQQNIIDMSALCLHLSTCIAKIRSQELRFASVKTKLITPRELQIAKLVALGRTNSEIGKDLWITENSVKQALKRIFRKLNVSSRTEMVVQLLD
ncbi:LuxR C-terminal-related transcriptional regulator [Pleurocapsa sp. PCC 7319]|uniref:helix-turn-helix transcriptional regulator n=1 Tax=Pleurocapsa sp. PCC 7319 TaxID=118161 RepID=UPI00034C35B2|nr:LuxR C-terminal-related transcriptional regulator [Pleurocapsa sp. PCC 7319]